MNKIILIGRLTKDPEFKILESGNSAARFTLAVNRNYKNKNGEVDADFFDVTAWNTKAVVIAKYVKKGNLLGVAGRVELNKVEKEDGSKKYYTQVILDELDLLEKKPKEEIPLPSEPYTETPSYTPVEEKQEEPVSDPFAEFGEQVSLSDDDLPF